MIAFVLRNAARELRGQSWRLLLIALCIATGFAAFFATYGFSGRVTEGLKGESRAMLGADLVVSARGAMPPEALEAVAALKEVQARCRVDDFPTMASTGPDTDTASRLVEIRSVEGPYPLAGRLVTEPPLPPGEPWGVLVDAGFAQAWGLRPGRPGMAEADLLRERRGLRLGDRVVPVQAVVASDDTRQAAAFSMGPRVYLGASAVAGSGLITPRSRFSSRILLRLAPGAAAAPVAERLRRALPPKLRIQTHEEAATSLAEPIRNLNLFIRQLGLFTLFLSSLGAWAILAAYLKGRERDAAILRCLGAAPGAPEAIFGLIAAFLVAGALILGYGAGSAAARALPGLLGDLIPQAIRRGPAPLPPLRETAAALLMLVLVLVPSLARLRNAGPLNLLRDLPGSGGGRLLAWACGTGAGCVACALVVLNAQDRRVGFAMAAAMALFFGLLFGFFRLLLALYRRTAPRLPLPLKLALGQMGARPALGSLLMAVIGLAVFIVLSSQFVKDDLIRPLARTRGDGTRANLFFLDVQPGQVAPLQDLLRARTGFEPMTSPVVRARLVSVAGRPVEEGALEGNAMLRREQNLTWRARPWTSEHVTRGRFWDPGPEPRGEISLEEGFARQIGAKLGDELVFDAQGTEVRGRVTSLRQVAWQSFQLNFFIVMHPSLLQDLPAFWLMAAEAGAPPARAALQNAVARDFPAVTTLDVGELVERVGRVLDLVALVTRALAGLMLVSALLVLAASLLAGHLERQRDLALLRTLGARHATLLGSLAWEFLLLGGGAAFTAGTLAWYLARAFSRGVLKLEGSPDPRTGALLVLAAAALTAAVGLAGSWRALQAKPMDVLRGA